MEAQYQQVAHDVGIKVRDREEALSREQNQLDEWRQKNINARKALVSLIKGIRYSSYTI